MSQNKNTEVEKYIRKRLIDADMSMSDLAAEMNLSVSGLRKKIKTASKDLPIRLGEVLPGFNAEQYRIALVSSVENIDFEAENISPSGVHFLLKLQESAPRFSDEFWSALQKSLNHLLKMHKEKFTPAMPSEGKVDFSFNEKNQEDTQVNVRSGQQDSAA